MDKTLLVIFIMNSTKPYKRANIYAAVFLFIFLRSKYQRIAAEHNIAINLALQRHLIFYGRHVAP